MKKKSSGGLAQGSPMEGRVIYDYQVRDLEGRLLTFLESLGLRESQEKSAKDIFKEIFYKTLYNETLWVSGEMLGPVVEAAYKEAKEMDTQPQWSRFPMPPAALTS